jgi:hypothetical protein
MKLNYIRLTLNKLKHERKIKLMLSLYMPSRHRGELDVQLYPYPNPALEMGGWTAPSPGRLTHAKETQYPFHRRLGGIRGRSEWIRKVMPKPGFKENY